MFTPHSRRRGLPIGNLTSQFWANVYMNRFDHWVKEVLRAPAYIRYVDDYVFFSNEKEELHAWQRLMQQRLNTLRLLAHSRKTRIHATERGVPFLGFRVFPYHRAVKKEKVRRYKRRLRKSMMERQAGLLSPDRLENQLNSWLGHVGFGMSRRLRYEVFWYLRREGVGVFVSPTGSWRVLECL